MAIRQVRGIFFGTLAQEDAGPVVNHFLDEAPPGGKITASGLVVQPLMEPLVAHADPVVDSVAILQGGQKQIDTPIGTETRQAAGQAPEPLPLWVIVAAAIAAVF